MTRNLVYLLLFVFEMPTSLHACDCGAPKPACAYLAADAIFLGRVSFTNDDCSGRFTQQTLVRFEVEERFRGVAPEVLQIWVDPGSFTSCYQNYDLGRRYLIFAARKTHVPSDTAAVTVMRDGAGNRKALPPGLDPANPPTIYHAPECAGSRPADFPHFDQDLAMLRAYRAGAVLPRVLGHVYLYPFRGWPVMSGPALVGARITMSDGVATLKATTGAGGTFSLENAPAGYYNAWADLAPFRMNRQSILHVPEAGCGYADIQLTTASTLEGVVLDHSGRPAPKIPVAVSLKDEKSNDALQTRTDENGQFLIAGLPDADAYLSAGRTYPTTRMPYKRVYYPKGSSPAGALVLRLKPGQHRQSMVLLLEPPLEQTRVRIRVSRKDGRPASKAAVYAFDDDGRIAESAKTDASGLAELPCLRGTEYKLGTGDLLKKGQRTPFTCDGKNTLFGILLDH